MHNRNSNENLGFFHNTSNMKIKMSSVNVSGEIIFFRLFFLIWLFFSFQPPQNKRNMLHLFYFLIVIWLPTSRRRFKKFNFSCGQWNVYTAYKRPYLLYLGNRQGRCQKRTQNVHSCSLGDGMWQNGSVQNYKKQ